MGSAHHGVNDLPSIEYRAMRDAASVITNYGRQRKIPDHRHRLTIQRAAVTAQDGDFEIGFLRQIPTWNQQIRLT